MASENVMELTDANFDEQVVQSGDAVLVDFWAEWCMPCRMLAPVIDELAGEYNGKIKVGKVDTDANRETSVKYGISAIPTVMLFDKGEVVKQFVGVTSKAEFAGELDKVTA